MSMSPITQAKRPSITTAVLVMASVSKNHKRATRSQCSASTMASAGMAGIT